MKKILLLASFVACLTTGGMVFGDPALEAGYTSTGYFMLAGNYIIYYDDNLKSMVIRCADTYYCIKNDNPDLYNALFATIQSVVSTGSNNNNSYSKIILWYKTIAGRNMIKAIGYRYI